MPWHLVHDHPRCKGWAVVKDSDGSLAGCHQTKMQAQAQLAALYANVKEVELDAVERAVDTSQWDANRAMTECQSAADYNKICAGKKAGDPALRSSHALPHHYLSKHPDPNEGGVRAALQRFDQTQGLTNSGEAKSHLEAHMKQINPDYQASQEIPRDDLRREISSSLATLEVRDVSTGAPVLAGHFARFDEWTEIDSFFEGRFMERIMQGAFLDSFEKRTPKITFQHGRDPELGDKILGSPLTVGEDELGGTYETPLFPGVPPLLVDGLRAGGYGSSFRFSVDEEAVIRKPKASEENPEALPERSIIKASVFEVGPVTFPAYAGATAGIRSITDQFRPATETVAEMARNHPGDLARMIKKALGSEAQPLEEQPPAPKVRRFLTREEFLEWVLKT